MPHLSARTRVGLAAACVAAVAGALLPPATVAAATTASAATVVRPPATESAELPLSVTDQTAHDLLEVRALSSRLGSDLAGVVTDVESGQLLWSRTPVEAQLPASTVKLLTAVTALESFGPLHRFRTTVTSGATPRRVVLVGAGDPSLTRRHLRPLARKTAAAVTGMGLRRIRVDVDDTLFPPPTLAYGWRASYVTADVSPVRALVVDHSRRSDTSLDAGLVFARLLARQGLQVRAVVRRARPVGATEIAAVEGDELATQVAAMLRTSDNDVAEHLHRLVAVQTGYPATWEGAAQAQVAALTTLGVPVPAGRVHDGSGLSRANRLQPAEVVALLAKVFDPAHPSLTPLRSGALAVAGVSGTLGPTYLRYVTSPTRCAAGLVEAKTGSLRGAIALSGYAVGADGRLKAFSFLLNQVPATLTTRRAVDELAATVTGCY